jgi:hypothetical protein
VIGTTLALFGLGLVMAVIACALVEIDAGRPIGVIAAYRLARPRVRPLLGSIGLFVIAWVVLTATAFLIPVAVWLAVRWCLIAPITELEDRKPWPALRRSGELVHRRWIRVGSLVGVSAAVALLAGPLLGVVLIFLTSVPFVAINIVAGIVYALLLPFVAIVTAYVYFDARARVELEAPQPSLLPAEIELGMS